MRRGKKAPELKLEVVEAEEMTEQQVEEVAHILATWIIRELEAKAQKITQDPSSCQGCGSQP